MHRLVRRAERRRAEWLPVHDDADRTETAPPPRFGMPLRVRYAECDLQGVAFNGVYLTWCDTAVTEYLVAIDLPYRDLLARGVDFMLAATSLRFRAPALPEDDLIVGVRVERLGRTSMTVHFPIRRRQDLLFEAHATYVFVDSVAHRPVEIPAFVRDAIGAHEGGVATPMLDG